MNQRVLLRIKNNQISFRFQGVLPCRFQSYLCLYKRMMPNMRWNGKARVWIVPLYYLTTFYELSRVTFGVKNICVLETDSIKDQQPVQYSLFQPEELR